MVLGIDIPVTIETFLEVLAIGVATFVLAWMFRWVFLRVVEHTGIRSPAARGVGRAIQAVIVIVGVLAIFAALQIDVSSVIIGVGAGSIAVSFALSTLLNNLVAGILILADDSVRVGDTIQVGGLQGRVVRIRTRATELETADRKRVFVPNVYLAQNPVVRMDRGKKGE